MKKTKKKKVTLDNVLTMVQKYSKDNEAFFIGSFVEFDKKDEVKDTSRIIAFGPKGLLKISLDELRDGLKNDKDDFINW